MTSPIDPFWKGPKPHSGQKKYTAGQTSPDNWRSYYGFNVDPFQGSSKRYTGGALAGSLVDVIRADQGDYGFGGGDLRRAFKAGHSAHSIAKYLMGDDMVGRDGAFYEAGGKEIGQNAMNQLRSRLQIEQSMKNAYHDQMKVRQDYEKKFKDYEDRFAEMKKQVATNTLAAQYKGTSTVQGGNALQINPYSSGFTNQQGIQGLLSAGVGTAFGRSNAYKTRTLNI